MNLIVFGLPGNENLAKKIINGINAEEGSFIQRQFPDGETYIRILSNVEVSWYCPDAEIDTEFMTGILMGWDGESVHDAP